MEIASISDIVDSLAETAPGRSAGDLWNMVIGDQLSAWRLRNAARIAGKTHKLLIARGVKLNREKIPVENFMAWFEYSSTCSDDKIQDMFANLLLNASQNPQGIFEKRAFDALSRLTPDGAHVMQRVYSEQPFPGMGPYEHTGPLDQPNSLEQELLGWPLDWSTALLQHFYPSADIKDTLEHLNSIGIVIFEDRLERGHPYNPDFQRLAGERSVDWDRIVYSRIAKRQHVVPTTFGKKLYDATNEPEPHRQN